MVQNFLITNHWFTNIIIHTCSTRKYLNESGLSGIKNNLVNIKYKIHEVCEFWDFFFPSKWQKDTDFLGHRFLLKSSTRDCATGPAIQFRRGPIRWDARKRGRKGGRGKREDGRARTRVEESRSLSSESRTSAYTASRVYRYHWIVASPRVFFLQVSACRQIWKTCRSSWTRKLILQLGCSLSGCIHIYIL